MLTFVLVPLFLLSSGCAGVLTGKAVVTETMVGKVEMDLRSRRKLKITEHDAVVEGDSVRSITVEWRNVSDGDITARIRTIFYRTSGEILVGDREGWVSYTIPPGGTQVLQWSAPGGKAARYVIRVESAAWLPL